MPGEKEVPTCSPYLGWGISPRASLLGGHNYIFLTDVETDAHQIKQLAQRTQLAEAVKF